MKKSELHSHLIESKRRIDAYDTVLTEAERTFRELNSRNMQATLIQVEDFFDSNNLYAFNNWFEGVIWDGPNVERYWIEITLQYPYKLMPEPRAMMRFGEMGVKYEFEDTVIMVPKTVTSPSDLDPTTRKPKEEESRIWLVTLKIPRHLVEDPMPDDTEDVDTVQNIQATDAIEEPSGEEASVEEGGAEEGGEEDFGGEDLDL